MVGAAGAGGRIGPGVPPVPVSRIGFLPMAPVRRPSQLALAVAAVLVGCGDAGPKRYGVTGTVTYKGKPIENGLISFVPAGSEASAGGAPITDGRYEIPKAVGLPAGEYRVIISVPTGGPAPKEVAPGVGAGERETREALPARYNSQTELRRAVKAGERNVFNFDLK